MHRVLCTLITIEPIADIVWPLEFTMHKLYVICVSLVYDVLICHVIYAGVIQSMPVHTIIRSTTKCVVELM